MDEAPQFDHIECLRCGYDLFNLPTDGACPECGTPISRTIDGNLLRYSSPAYLDKLSRGIMFIVLSYLLSIGMGIVIVIVAFATGFWVALGGAGPVTLPVWVTVIAAFASLIGLGVGVLSLLGWWWFSEPDPEFLGNDTAHGYRQGLRVMVVLFAIIMVVSAPINFMSWLVESLAIDAASMVFGLVSGLLGVVLFFVSLQYVRVIAQRIPNRDMVQRSRLYLWLLPVIYVFGLVCIGLGPLVATVLYLLLLWWLRKEVMAIQGQIGQAEHPLAVP